MADISLQEYLENVETLLQGDNNDEVVQHCRHILRYYPKNAAAYRLLGQALLHGNSLDEAEAILRRVLSVYPDDYVAHLGLSEIQERRGNGNEAIWHLERAFEQTPNDAQITEKLRELYRRYRQTNQDRIQLTSGALARQYIRSGLHTQAIGTLQSALDEAPKRADLRLLLASTFWDSGHEVEGAEAALDVLKILPDCVQANQILAWLWLAEGRPSDAQRYVSRIEAVDPYLAFQMVQSAPPPDDAFTLPELDYTSIARRRLATSQPDWLQEIDQREQEAAPVDDDWMAMAAGDVATDAPSPADEALETPMPADWMLDEAEASEAVEADDLFAEFGTAEDTPDESPVAETEAAPARTGMTDLLSRLDEPEAQAGEAGDGIEMADLSFLDEEDLPDADWLAVPNDPTGDIEEELPASGWLGEAGAFQAASDVDDDMAWLESAEAETGVHGWEPEQDDTEWLQQAEALTQGGTDTLPGTDDEDPLAWLHESGVELSETEGGRTFPTLDEEGDMNFEALEAEDPFAWMRDSGVEMHEAENTPDLFAGMDSGELATGEFYAAEDSADPLAWLHESGVEMADDEAAPVDTPPEAPATASSPADDMAWLQDESLLDEALDIEALQETGSLSAEDIEEAEELPAPHLEDHLPLGAGALDAVTMLATDEPQEIPDEAQPSLADIYDETDGQTTMSDPNDQELPDWLSSSSSEDDAFSWLNDAEGDDTGEPDDENALDWMAEIPDEAAESPSTMDVSFEEQPGEDSGFDWLNTEPDEPEAEPVNNVPDWLAGAAPAETSGESDFEWLAMEGDNADEEAQPMESAPDWLAEAAPLAQSEAGEPDEPQDAEQFSWEATDEEAQPMESAPDWLADIAPAAEAATNEPETVDMGESEIDWQAVGTQEDDETPAWMTEAADTEADSLYETESASDELEWLTTDTTEATDEETAAPASDTPDWLRQAAPSAEFMGEDEPESPEGEQFEWLAAEGEDDEPAAETSFTWETDEDEDEALEQAGIGSETPDWLSEIAPVGEADSDEMAEAEDEAADSFAWSAESEPDWLADLAAHEEEDDDADEVAETSADDDVPAWLAEAAPSADEALAWAEDDEAQEIAFSTDAAQSEFGWLGEQGADDEAEIAAGAEPAVTEWADDYPVLDEEYEVTAAEEFAPLDDQEMSEQQAAFVPGADALPEDGDADYSDETEQALAAAAAPPPAENAPDWLNAMVPGLDLKYEPEAEAEEIAEQDVVESPQAAARDFNWLTEIVDEETAQVETVRETAEESGRQADRQRRFVFSRRPAWMRGKTESKDQPDDDEDDFSLPDWLK